MNQSSDDTSNRVIERVEIHLKYEGPDVENGTMALQDIIPVLQGFSGAYATIAATEDPDSTHRIKISAVQRGSADIVLEVWKWLGDNASSLASVGTLAAVGGVAFNITKKILDVARIKCHVGDRPSTEHISSENSIVISNSENVQIVVSLSTFEAYKKGELDRDLERLTKPLEKGRIDSAEFEVKSSDGGAISHRVTAEDRPYFEIEELAITSTREIRLVAKLNSLTKSTNSGYLHLQNEKRVFYRYLGDDCAKLYSIFGNYDGLVEIRCEARMDDRLEVVSLDVFQIDRMQDGLFDNSSSPTNE